MSVEAKRVRAGGILFADPSKLAFRSCWNCNLAHEHLKDVDDFVIRCFECGHYFFDGEDITEDEKPTEPSSSDSGEPK